jgi:hypothetical protein
MVSLTMQLYEQNAPAKKSYNTLLQALSAEQAKKA